MAEKLQNSIETDDASKKQSLAILLEKSKQTFIEKEFASGPDLYNMVTGNPDIATIEKRQKVFIAFLANYPLYKESGLSEFYKEKKHSAEDFKNFCKYDVIRFGVVLSERRKDLKKMVFSRFDSAKTSGKIQDAALENAIKTLSPALVKEFLSSGPKKLSDWVIKTFGVTPEDMIDPIPELDMTKLSEKQKRIIAKLEAKKFPPTSSDLDVIFSGNLFNDIQKKTLLSFFMPTITVQELVKFGFLKPEEVHTVIAGIIQKSDDVPQSQKDELCEKSSYFIDGFDLSDITVPTSEFIQNHQYDSMMLSDAFLSRVNAELDGVSEDDEEDTPAEKLEAALEETLGAPTDDPNVLPENAILPKFLEILKSQLSENVSDIDLLSKLRDGEEVPLYLSAKSPDGEEMIFRIDWIVSQERTSPGAPQVCIHTLYTDPQTGDLIDAQGTGNDVFDFSQFYNLLAGFEAGSFMTRAAAKHHLHENGKTDLVKDSNELTTIAGLREAFDDVDPAGKSYDCLADSTTFFATTKDNKRSVFRITSFPGGNQVCFTNGENVEGPYPISVFAANLRNLKVARIAPMKDISSFLKTAQTSITGVATDFGKIEVNKKGNGMIFSDSKDDSKVQNIEYFTNKDKNTTLEIKKIQGDSVTMKLHTGVKDNKASKTVNARGSWELVFSLLEQHGLSPVDPKKSEPVTTKETPGTEKSGLAGRLLQNLSIFEIIGGGKKLIKLAKDHLEHNSNYHTARAAVGFAKILGMKAWNPHLLEEFEAGIFSEEKKLVETALEALNKMSPPAVRHKHIRAILDSKGSSQDEILAATLSMLEKHGTLYVGGNRDMDGTWAFFKRLRGLPGNANVFTDPAYLDAKSMLEKDGLEVREESIIYVYLRTLAGKGMVNPNYWIMVKNKWKDGMAGEKENGKKEAGENLPKMEAKLTHVKKKFTEGEYAAGLGALDPIFKQGGTPGQMNLPGVLLILTGIPDRLRDGAIKDVWLTTYDGKPYPSLWFTQSAETRETFKKTLEQLIKDSGDENMKEAYTKAMNAKGKTKDGKTSTDEQEKIGELYNFWEKYGDGLSKKLSITPDHPDIFLKKDENKVYNTYYETWTKMFNQDDNFSPKPEMENNGDYANGHSSFILTSPETWFDKIKFGGGHGAIEGSEDQKRFSQVIEAYKSIRNIEWNKIDAKNPVTPEKLREEKKKIFATYHKATMKKFMAIKEDMYKQLVDGKQDHAKELRRLGIHFPDSESIKSMTREQYLESSLYKENLNEDFERFLAGKTYVGESSLKVNGMHVERAVNDILIRPNAGNVTTAAKNTTSTNPLNDIHTSIKYGNGALAQNRDPIIVKKHVDNAYAGIKSINPKNLSPSDKIIFDGLCKTHGDLARNYSNMASSSKTTH